MSGVAGCLSNDEIDGTNDDTDDDDPSTSEFTTIDLEKRPMSGAFPLELVEPDATVGNGYASYGDLVANVHGHGDFSHWHFAPLTVPSGGSRTTRARFMVDEPLAHLPIGSETETELVVTVIEPASSPFEVHVETDLVTIVDSEDRVTDTDNRENDNDGNDADNNRGAETTENDIIGDRGETGMLRFELWFRAEEYWTSPPLSAVLVDSDEFE